MRKLVIDFDLTILWPLIAVALVSLWSSARAYRTSSAYCKAAIIRLKGVFDTQEEGEEWLKWGQKQHTEKRQARDMVIASFAILLVLSVTMLISDKWKLHVAYLVWDALFFLGFISFIVTVWNHESGSEVVDHLDRGQESTEDSSGWRR